MTGFHPSDLELVVQTQVGHSAPVLLELFVTVELKKKRELDEDLFL